jgi:hypothetical protein
MDDLNAKPVVKSLKSEFEFRQGDTTVISLDKFVVEDLEEAALSLSVINGENYTVIDKNKLVPEPDFSGEFVFSVVVSDGFSNSEQFEITAEVAVNTKPQITTDNEFIMEQNESLTLSTDDFTITPGDNDEITLKILEGVNYAVAETTIAPDADFLGDLTVGVVANDGFQNSDTLNITVKVVGLITGVESERNKFSVYPNHADNVLFVETNDISIPDFVIYNAMGGKMISGKLQSATKNELSIQHLPPGIYFLKSGKNKNVRIIKK